MNLGPLTARFVALVGILGIATAVFPPASATAQEKYGVLEAPVTAIDCSAISTDPAALGAASVYVIVPAESEARYLAEEELANIGANTAVGSTNAIQGGFLLDVEGSPLACSSIYVDIRTFTSDESRRDNFLRGNTLESDQYPLAEFVVTGVEGFTAPADEGAETTFTLVGNFTLHGVTKTVAWEATASKSGDSLTGSAHTEFNMADFDIQKPIVGSVISIEDVVRLEIDLVAANNGA